MIPILFDATETAFTSNGIGRLADATKCEVTEERNGQYELVLEYPVEGKMYKELQCGRYIYATHDEGKVPQAFQIYQISTPLQGMVTVNAWHISYALNTIIVAPFTAGSCTAAIAGVKSNSMNTNPFTFWTDKSVTASFSLTVPASARACLGGMQGSILDVYGTAEYEFDMYTVKLHQHRGQNRDVSIRYGKNLTKLDQTLDASNVYNACVPYWTNDETTVVSDSIVTRSGETTGRTIAMDLSSAFESEPTVAQLKSAAQTKLDASDNYQLKENLKVDFVALWQTEEYKNYSSLQRIYLCDTVNIFYSKLGINVTAKCIKVVYDTLRERYSSMELGEPSTSLIQEIQEQVAGEIIPNVPSMSTINGAIQHATELIAGGFGGYIKFNYLPDGTPSEMLIMDSADESTAVNIIRLNQNGLGFSTDGGSTYANAWTIDGNLNATFITTGVLNANLLTAGMIQDANGDNYWNLDTGQFVTKQGTIADFTIASNKLHSGTVGVGTDGSELTNTGLRYSYYNTSQQRTTLGGLNGQFLYFKIANSGGSFVPAGEFEPGIAASGYGLLNIYVDSTDPSHIQLFDADDTSHTSKINFNYPATFLDALNLQNGLVIVSGGATIEGTTQVTNGNLQVYNGVQQKFLADTSGNVTAAGTAQAKHVDVLNSSSNGSSVDFKFSDKSNAAAAAVYAALSNNVGQLYLREHSGDYSGLSTYYEDYRLPAPDSGRYTNATYEILTTKQSSPVLCYKGVASGDMNDYTEMGVYSIGGTALANGPTNGTWCYFIVISGNNTVQQICFNSNMNLFVRNKTGSPLAWTAWKALYPA